MYYQRGYNPYNRQMINNSLTNTSDVDDTFPKDPVLAMAYMKMQRFENFYSPKDALKNGTLFIDLDKKFCG